MAMGTCPECGYSPVAPGARACPKCWARNPNPGVADRFFHRLATPGGDRVNVFAPDVVPLAGVVLEIVQLLRAGGLEGVIGQGGALPAADFLAEVSPAKRDDLVAKRR